MAAEEKRELRKEIRKKRRQLSMQYCQDADERIFRHAVSLPEYEKAETVFCYVGTRDEIDTLPLLKDILKRGKRLGVPKCISKGIMKVFEIRNLESLEEGAYGILEPAEGCSLIEPAEIDLAYVPCLSCSTDGRRLGFGGGYYDRYLQHVRFPGAVLCRSRLMSEEIPMDAYDRRMDIVISEEQIIRVHP